MVVHYDNKVCGQSRLIVPRFPGSGILVPCRHGQILWLHRCGMRCHRHWCQAILSSSWCGRNSWSLFHLVAGVAGAADVGCMHGAGGGDAGCAT